MKFLLLPVLLTCFSFSTLTETPPDSADKIMKAAYKQAAKQKKNVLVLFHASWCSWCHKMNRSLNDPIIKYNIDRNYVLVHMTVYEFKGKEDLETPGALDFITKYGGNDLGLPYWLILDAKGNLLGDAQMESNGKKQNTGCPASKEEVAHFVQVLQKTSSLKQEELTVIEKRFRANEE